MLKYSNRKNSKYFEKLLPIEAVNYLNNPDWDDVEQDLAWANKTNCHLITLNHPAYPFYLRQIPNPPLVLYIKGNLKSLNKPQVALVGTRNPSFSGQEIAFQFAHDLAKNHIVVTSGLARGIDSFGHQGALAANGHTIAVLGSGINYIYPKKHLALAEKISEQGAIISEFPLKTPPLAKHFPQRNRIISGLSQGVLIVEAAMNSGSLLTARLANEQGREVFAIPGSIHNALTRGCHHLIQAGAKLVATLDDIFEELNCLGYANPQVKKAFYAADKLPPMTIKEKKIWQCINFDPTPPDLIALRSGLTIDEVSSILLSFEINGLIVSTPVGYLRSRKFLSTQ